MATYIFYPFDSISDLQKRNKNKGWLSINLFDSAFEQCTEDSLPSVCTSHEKILLLVLHLAN
jgi:hypothetical protein